MIPIPEEWVNLAFTSVSTIKSEIVALVKTSMARSKQVSLGNGCGV